VRGLEGGVEGQLQPPPDPKGHIVVAHVPWFVDEYGICGIFGEGGCEALPDARHKAHTLHLTARSFTPVLDR
jgi:hypothetical protein